MKRLVVAAALAVAACSQPEPEPPKPTIEAFGTGASTLDGAARCLVVMQVWAQHKRDGFVPTGEDPQADVERFNTAASNWAGVYDRARIANGLSEQQLQPMLKGAFDEARARGAPAIQAVTMECLAGPPAN